MTDKFYDVVVCGAGMAGIATAYSLAIKFQKRVLLIDEGAPLSLTSDKSTECYRNWWGGPDNAMLSLMNRSINLMEEHAVESNNSFQMRPHGYLFVTKNNNEADQLYKQAKDAELLGVGCLREITKFSKYKLNNFESPISDQDGSDFITNKETIKTLFPYLNKDTEAVLHVRRCGSLSAQQLGMHLLEKAREKSCEFQTGKFTGIETSGGKVSSVTIEQDGIENSIATDTLVLAPGPHLKNTLEKIGLDLPVLVEKHVKISLPDTLNVVPRDAPLIIWNDPIELPWTNEEKSHLAESPETEWLLKTFPPGVHGRPVGAGNQVLMYWTYDCETSTYPKFPIEWDPYLPDVTLRGMAVMVPGLEKYFDPMPRPYVDGGYYTKTEENRPLIGPLKIPGAFVCGAFSGFGIMSACGAGELLARHITKADLPDYADAFLPSRYEDPLYLEEIKKWVVDGQL